MPELKNLQTNQRGREVASDDAEISENGKHFVFDLKRFDEDEDYT